MKIWISLAITVKLVVNFQGGILKYCQAMPNPDKVAAE